MKNKVITDREEVESVFYDASIKNNLPLTFSLADAIKISDSDIDEPEIWKEASKWITVPFYQTEKYYPTIFYKPVSKIWKL